MQPGSGGPSRRQRCRACGAGAPRSRPALTWHRRPSPASRGRRALPGPGARPARDSTAQEWRPPRPGAAPEPPGPAARARHRPAGSAAAEAGAGGPGAAGTRTRPGHGSSPSGRSDRPPPAAAPARSRLLTQALPRRGFQQSTTPSARETYLSPATAIC